MSKGKEVTREGKLGDTCPPIKHCPKCDKDLPLDRFYIAYWKKGKAYYMSHCKNCSNGAAKNRIAKKRGVA